MVHSVFTLRGRRWRRKNGSITTLTLAVDSSSRERMPQRQLVILANFEATRLPRKFIVNQLFPHRHRRLQLRHDDHGRPFNVPFVRFVRCGNRPLKSASGITSTDNGPNKNEPFRINCCDDRAPKLAQKFTISRKPSQFAFLSFF